MPIVIELDTKVFWLVSEHQSGHNANKRGEFGGLGCERLSLESCWILELNWYCYCMWKNM